MLRLLDTYAAKSHPSCTFPSITPLLDHVSKICIEGSVQGGSDFCMILQHKCLVTLRALYKYTQNVEAVIYTCNIDFWHHRPICAVHP